MYNGFFSFREKPFKLIPNPKFLFLGKSHKNALAHLAYAISQGDGFVEITGEVGAGKTTLCRAFLEDLDENIEAAFIFNPKLTSVQLLKTLHKELGINSNSMDIIDLTHSLNQFLLKKKAQGKSVILLIDEAQHLGKDTLEQLRLLSNLETTKNKLLQIILVGQPELSDLLNSFNMRQLRQRINLSCHIQPLTLEETRRYIKHRINIASKINQDLFSPKAQKLIYDSSKGIPRKINILCDRSLLAAYSLNKKKVNAAIVNIAIKELHDPKKYHSNGYETDTKIALWPFLLIILSFIILVLAYNHIPLKLVSGTAEKIKSEPTHIPETGKPVKAVPKPISETTRQTNFFKPIIENEPNIHPVVPALPLLTTEIPDSQTREQALSSILFLWESSSLPRPENFIHKVQDDLDFFRINALHNNFLIFHIEQWDKQVEKYNLPAILELATENNTPPRYIVVSKISSDNDYIFSNKDIKESFKIAKKELAPFLTGKAFIACRNIFGNSDIINEDSPRFSILSAKLILQQIGYTAIKTDAVYSVSVKNAVRQIQKKYGLNENGLVGPMTKLALICERNNPSTPFLTPGNLPESSEERQR